MNAEGSGVQPSAVHSRGEEAVERFGTDRPAELLGGNKEVADGDVFYRPCRRRPGRLTSSQGAESPPQA